MKKIYVLALSLCCSISVWAQKSLLKGLVKDKQEQRIAYATVRIQDKEQHNFDKIANETGAFEIDLPSNTTYTVKVSAVGYSDTTFKLSKFPTSELIITLTQSENTLNGVEVISKRKKPLVERKIDRVVMNISDNGLTAGRSSLELLSLAPGVFVNQGVITVNGVAGARVMINGRLLRLSGNDLKNYLQSLKASDIESVEIIANPPAEYEAEGSGGLVNIILKKSNTRGFNGSIGNEYSQGLGKYPGLNPSLSLNYNTQKLQINSSINYSQGKFFQDIGQSRTLLSNGIKGQYDAKNNFIGNEKNLSARLGINYEISTKQNISLEYARSKNQERDYTTSTSLISFAQAPANNLYSEGVFPIIADVINDNYTLNYSIKTDDKGSKLTLISDFTTKTGDNSSGTFSNTYNTQGTIIGDTSFYYHSPSNARIFTSNLQYDWNLHKKIMISVGGKGTFSTIKNNNYYDILKDNTWNRPSDLSFNYQYKEQIMAGFVNLSGSLKSIQYKLGLRGENSYIEGLLTGSQQAYFPRNYFNLFPNINIKKNLDSTGMNSISLNYNRRLNRPAYFDLNPFKFFIDNYSVQTGNPYLNPSYTSKYAASYILKGKYFTELAYSHTKDVINTVIENDPDKEVLVLLNKNTGTSAVWSATFSIPVEFTKWWKANNTLLLTHTKNESPEFLIKKSNFIAETQHEFNFGKGWQSNLSVFYTPSIIDGNIVLKSLASVDLSIQKKFFKDKLNTSLSISDIFYTNKVRAYSYYKGAQMYVSNNRQSRRGVISLTYYFKQGKDFNVKQIKNSNEEEKNRLRK